MKKIIVLFLLVFMVALWAVDRLEMMIYNFPEYDFYNYNALNSWQDSVKTDSIKQINIFSGRILNHYIDDIFTLTFLQNIDCDIAVPVDYFFNKLPRNYDFTLLATNLYSDSLVFADHKIVETDSMKVAFFSIYTPDLAVKSNYSDKVKLHYKIFDLVEKYSKTLAAKCDYVVLISSLSKIIDKDIVQGLPIDLVISFDYQKKNSGLIAGTDTYFFSNISKTGEIGRIRLTYDSGKITEDVSNVMQDLEIFKDPKIQVE